MSKAVSVLIVDDRPSMASTLADLLEAKGFTVHDACSGAEALAILRKHAVDVMLTDVIMEEMNGVALYRETKKIQPGLTTFFMTAYSADELIEQGMKEGIKAVLNKPLDIELLIMMLRVAGGNSK
jgi:CheY-like chemotaxis protein